MIRLWFLIIVKTSYSSLQICHFCLHVPSSIFLHFLFTAVTKNWRVQSAWVAAAVDFKNFLLFTTDLRLHLSSKKSSMFLPHFYSQQSPKMEALSLLGSLLPLSSLYPSMPVLQPSASDLTLMNCSDVKVQQAGGACKEFFIHSQLRSVFELINVCASPSLVTVESTLLFMLALVFSAIWFHASIHLFLTRMFFFS